MSVSSSCNTYFVDVFDNVTGNSTDSGTCDSTLTTCTITTPNGNSVGLTCNSKLQSIPDSADFSSSEYFCVCGDNPLSVPSIVNCASFCYKLSTSHNCNFLTLYDGFTSGNSDIAVSADECSHLSCNQAGTICTTDQQTSYQCDNIDHDLPGPSSTKSYVCNCAGPAAIPEIYQQNGKTMGTACGNANSATETPAPSVRVAASATVTTSSTIPSGNSSEASETSTAAASAVSSRGNSCSLKTAPLVVLLLLTLGLAL